MTDPTDLPNDDDGLVRLQKLLAQSGVASRRRCEELMLAGEVEVDGEVVTRLGTKVDPRVAVIKVSGHRLPPVSDHLYLVLNKPRGVVSTMSDPQGGWVLVSRTLGNGLICAGIGALIDAAQDHRRTLYERVPRPQARLHPVIGRHVRGVAATVEW